MIIAIGGSRYELQTALCVYTVFSDFRRVSCYSEQWPESDQRWFSVLEDLMVTPAVARQAELLSLVQKTPRSSDSDVIAWTLRNESFLSFQFFAELVKRISGRNREAAGKYEIFGGVARQLRPEPLCR